MIWWLSVLVITFYVVFWTWMGWLLFTAPEFDEEDGWK